MTEKYPSSDKLRTALVDRANEYSRVTGTALYAIGVEMGKGRNFFREIAGGRNFTVNTYEEVMTWFDCNWPKEKAGDSAGADGQEARQLSHSA